MSRVFPTGPIRPPSEANSLLLQVTEGCTWNKCRFCCTYKGQPFKVLQADELKANIDIMAEYRDRVMAHVKPDGTFDRQAAVREMQNLPYDEQNCYYLILNWLLHGGKTVFMQDGNTVALKPEKLADVLIYLRKKFPHIERITSFARAETLARWSVEELTLLRESGLDRVHSGFESGSDKVLELIDKGLTQAQEIEAGKKVIEAGMELSVYFMPGIGGLFLSEENAVETAKVVSAIDPHFVRLRSFVVKEDTDMWYDFIKGDFIECDDFQKLQEIKTLIEKVEGCTGKLVSDHIVNLIGDLTGYFDKDRDEMLSKIDSLLSLNERDRRIYQLARRTGMIEGPSGMGTVPAARIKQFEQAAERTQDPDEWNKMIDGILRNYV